MSVNSRSLVGSLILTAVLALTYGGLCIYTARRDLVVARNESTTTGQARLHPQSKDPNLFDSLRCDYTFMVNGSLYVGYGICPRQTDHSVKGILENAAGLLQDQKVTVYYDPADPSTNSMMDFSAKSAYDYKKAKASFLVGGSILIFVAIGALYLSGANEASQGVAPDPNGAVIDPGKMDFKQQEYAAYPERVGPQEEQTNRSAND